MSPIALQENSEEFFLAVVGLRRYNTREMSKMSQTEKIFLWMLGVFLLCLGLWALVRVLVFSETDYQEDTRRYHQKLVDILNDRDEVKKRDGLHELAIEIGAGAEHTVIGTPYKVDEHWTTIPQTIISESEIVNNINVALQTRSTLSGQEQAKKSNLIAFLALVVAVLSGLVSVFAILATRRNKKQRERQKLSEV